jgi:hydrophobe/amphiphile efflux-1 (HAE1) family protein
MLEASHSENRYFAIFNRGFDRVTKTFLGGVNLALAKRVAAGLAFLAVIAILGLLFWRVPTSFIPPEDQGYIIGSIVLPDGASMQRTQKTGTQLMEALRKHPEVDHAFVVPGRDFIGGGNKPNAGTAFVLLKDWDDRSKTAPELAAELTKEGGQFGDGMAVLFNPPAIRGLGTAGGFEFYVQSRLDADPKRLGDVVNTFTAALAADPQLQGINSFFRPTAPQLRVDVDREKALSLGVPVTDVFDALAATLGALYVNDYNIGGRTFRVQLQSEAQFRARPDQIGEVYVRSGTSGEMIPVKAVLRVSNVVGAEQVDRFNGFVAAKVLGSGKAGVSSGQAIQAVERVAAATLPAGYSLSWSGQAFQEKRTGTASLLAFGLAIVMVYLILSALYERWRLPSAVVLAVPFAVMGALGLVALRGMENDIYFQIGLVVLIGLAAKNAILIVEFAQQGLLEGMDAKEAALQAARLRFRPIVMTSLAFVFGVLPLAIASGAGASARRSMGTGVVGGMMLATFVATIFVPLFFTVFARKNRVGEGTPVRFDSEAPTPPPPKAAGDLPQEAD